MVAKTTLVFLLIGIIPVVQPFGPKAGPYDIAIEKAETCEEQGSGKVVFGTRITNAGRGKYLYKENFSLGYPVDQYFKIHAELQKWGNGGWRPKAIEQTFKNCETAWKILGDFMKSLMQSAGHPIEKCPVPAGNYTAKDWVIELNLEKTAPVMEYAKYRAIMRLYYKNEMAGCFRIYGETTPKALG